MSERTDADKLAQRLLEEPNAGPDDDLRMLSRQLLRRNEVIDRLTKALTDAQDPARDMIVSNIEATLKKHEEAVSRIRNVLRPHVEAKTRCLRIVAILDALAMFHPMHGESWAGWPKEE